MATGFYDANGIWNYGEDDNIALFSDTLNKLADSTSDAFTSDRSRISTLEAGSLSGLIPVKPSVATFTGGTGAITSVGMVTFTACTGLTLSGVFSAAYKNYRVVMTGRRTTTAAAGIAFMRLSTGGTTINTNYTGGYTGWYIGGSSVVNAGGTDGVYFSPVHYGNNVLSMDIYNPNEATVTRFVGNSLGSVGASGTVSISGASHELDASYDGVSILWNSGSWTGSVQVFGYND